MIFTCTLFLCLASFSQAYLVETTPYCSMKQYTVTQVGIESSSGIVAIRGRHRVLSVLDYVNERFYTNYTLSLADSMAKTVTIGYELIVDVPNGANYVIKNGKCKKYRLPDQLQGSFTPCLNGVMTPEGTSYLDGFKGSLKAIKEETFRMDLEVADGEDKGMTGQLWLTYAKNPDDPDTYLLLKEEMVGSLQLPDSSEPISTTFSSQYVDYVSEVDENRFDIPSDCPEEFEEGNYDGHNRYRRSLATKSFQAARFDALMLLTP